MKIFLLLFLFIFGCKEKNLLDELEMDLYGLDEVFVLMDQEEVYEKFEIEENEYEDFLALKTLVFYEQKEFFIFYKISDSFKEEILLLNEENCIFLEIDSYFYYGINDSNVLDIVKKTLNK